MKRTEIIQDFYLLMRFTTFLILNLKLK